jgi:hypothetical protein
MVDLGIWPDWFLGRNAGSIINGKAFKERHRENTPFRECMGETGSFLPATEHIAPIFVIAERRTYPGTFLAYPTS